MNIELTEKESKILTNNFIPLIEAFLIEKNMFMVTLFSVFKDHPKAGEDFINKMVKRITEIYIINKP